MSHKSTWVYGLHAVEARLAESSAEIIELWLSDTTGSSRRKAIGDLASSLGVKIIQKSSRELDKTIKGVHQGVALRCRMSARFDEGKLEELLAEGDVLFLVLDGIMDPRNLGACIRSAAALGVSAVITTAKRSAPLNAAAIKAASGGVDRIPLVEVPNLARSLRWLKQWGVCIVGTHVDSGVMLSEADLTGSLALVVGSEDKGLRRLTLDQCDQRVRIPQANQQNSLNVSVATGICLYEINRQRL